MHHCWVLLTAMGYDERERAERGSGGKKHTASLLTNCERGKLVWLKIFTSWKVGSVVPFLKRTFTVGSLVGLLDLWSSMATAEA